MVTASCPARALAPSTCWRVAVAPDAVTWYETEDRARRALALAMEGGGAVWLVSPADRIVAHAPQICDRCERLGYPAAECGRRISAEIGDDDEDQEVDVCTGCGIQYPIAAGACPACGAARDAGLTIPFAGPIDSAADVRAFYSAVEDAGVSYHPDTRFADVVEHATGRPTFDAIEAARLESLAERCHVVAPDPYKIALAVWRERNPS